MKQIKLKKVDRQEIFVDIVKSLMTKKVDKLKVKEKKLATRLHRYLNRTHLKELNALPEGFMPTQSMVHLETRLPRIHLDYLYTYYAKGGFEGYYKSSLISNLSYLTLEERERVRFKDQHKETKLTIGVLTVPLHKALVKFGDECTDLTIELREIMKEVWNALASCTNVKQLTELLPEFKKFYPKENVTNLPAIIPNVGRIQQAYKESK